MGGASDQAARRLWCQSYRSPGDIANPACIRFSSLDQGVSPGHRKPATPLCNDWNVHELNTGVKVVRKPASPVR